MFEHNQEKQPENPKDYMIPFQIDPRFIEQMGRLEEGPRQILWEQMHGMIDLAEDGFLAYGGVAQ